MVQNAVVVHLMHQSQRVLKTQVSDAVGKSGSSILDTTMGHQKCFKGLWGTLPRDWRALSNKARMHLKRMDQNLKLTKKRFVFILYHPIPSAYLTMHGFILIQENVLSATASAASV